MGARRKGRVILIGGRGDEEKILLVFSDASVEEGTPGKWTTACSLWTGIWRGPLENGRLLALYGLAYGGENLEDGRLSVLYGRSYGRGRLEAGRLPNRPLDLIFSCAAAVLDVETRFCDARASEIYNALDVETHFCNARASEIYMFSTRLFDCTFSWTWRHIVGRAGPSKFSTLETSGQERRKSHVSKSSSRPHIFMRSLVLNILSYRSAP